MEKLKVRQFISDNGNAIPNQFEIETPKGLFFQSYSSIIAVKHNGEITLDKNYWDYSRTTGKYRNMFLYETKKETEKKIKSGEYKLADLNGEA